MDELCPGFVLSENTNGDMNADILVRNSLRPDTFMGNVGLKNTVPITTRIELSSVELGGRHTPVYGESVQGRTAECFLSC